ncbi:MAG: hypothetical protein M3Y17_15345 [Actinomycetota bacterium]|nr:hypothetical protein [Actinomycetota bacterium]
MKASILDELPGVGPARAGAAAALGSPDAILSASREQLEGLSGVSATARARAAQDWGASRVIAIVGWRSRCYLNVII